MLFPSTCAVGKNGVSVLVSRDWIIHLPTGKGRVIGTLVKTVLVFHHEWELFVFILTVWFLLHWQPWIRWIRDLGPSSFLVWAFLIVGFITDVSNQKATTSKAFCPFPKWTAWGHFAAFMLTNRVCKGVVLKVYGSHMVWCLFHISWWEMTLLCRSDSRWKFISHYLLLYFQHNKCRWL